MALPVPASPSLPPAGLITNGNHRPLMTAQQAPYTGVLHHVLPWQPQEPVESLGLPTAQPTWRGLVRWGGGSKLMGLLQLHL